MVGPFDAAAGDHAIFCRCPDAVFAELDTGKGSRELFPYESKTLLKKTLIVSL